MTAMQMDWVGATPKPKVRIEIPDRKPLVAERKAVLAKQIGDLTRRAPEKVKNGSVQIVRAWTEAAAQARAAAGRRNASVVELETALKNLRAYED